jgi:hypothetical protein
MTRKTNARIAGFTFLFYIAAGITSLILENRAIKGDGIAAKLASVAQHATDMRVIIVLTLLCSLSAIVLGVTLHAITREQDPDLAMLGLICRVVEGVNGGPAIAGTASLLWLATATGANAPDVAATHALAPFLLRGGGALGATFFAIGSTCFSWLLLRGRMIPVPLARLGVVASVLLVAVLPLQFAGFVSGPVLNYVWLPMLLFEVPLAFWLLVKGVAPVLVSEGARP